MPIVLTCDGPSLGGFVCPATIPSTDLWKMGQVSPNDKVTFKQLTLGEWAQPPRVRDWFKDNDCCGRSENQGPCAVTSHRPAVLQQARMPMQPRRMEL